MHRFLSGSDESADLSALRHARGHPFAGRTRKCTLCSTLRRPTEWDAVRADDFGAAVENLCLVRAESLIEDFQNFFELLLNFGKGLCLIHFGGLFE